MSGTHAETVRYVRDTMLPEQAPPATEVGAVGWLRENLFSGWFNTVVTLASLAFIYLVLSIILPWTFSPTWNAASLNECRDILAAMGRDGHFAGACWGVINDRWVQLLFGFYPSEIYWRPVAALVLLGVALAPVLFSEYVPRKLIWFSALYPVLMPWLLWGGAIWAPLLVIAGLGLAYAGFRLIAARSTPALGLIGAVAIALVWFLWGLGAINDGINRAIGEMRKEARIAQLEQTVAALPDRLAQLEEQIDATSAQVTETLAAAKEAEDPDPQVYVDLLNEVAPARAEVKTMRREFSNLRTELSEAETLLQQARNLAGLREAMPDLRETYRQLRESLPDTVSHVLTEDGMTVLESRIREEGLDIPPEDVDALEASLDASQEVQSTELAVEQTYAELARIGLKPVESRKFGGFMLSLTIGVVAIAISLPLGVVLALGRQSDLLIVKGLCVGFIEFIRGVPLITLLFVASTLLNIFMPPGTDFDIILRVIIMATLFASAYMAEVVRGGLAALPTGQYEGADSLGLDYWQAQRLIIMPQALKISIPGIVSTFIGLFKDTTLVSIIGLLDPLGLSNAIRADSDWNGIVWELYGFIALLFFIFCFGMSRYSMYLERKLQTGHR